MTSKEGNVKAVEMKEDKQQSISGADVTPSELIDSPDAVAPTWQEIEMRAYSIHQAHGSIHGDDFDDWLQAERELTEERSLDSKTPRTI
jgi:DUF2934 family protein